MSEGTVLQKMAKAAIALCNRRITSRTYICWFLIASLAQLLFWVVYPQGGSVIHADALLSLVRGGVPVHVDFIHGESGDNALVRPMAVLSAQGRVFVSDAGSQRILVFDSDGGFVMAIGGPGNGPGQFLFPKGLAADKEALLVADLYTGLISRFDKNGVFQSYFLKEYRQDGVLQAPSALAVFAGRLYVTDVKRSRVLVFNLSDGGLVKEIGMDEDISAPNGVAVDEDGFVYVTSSRNQYIAVYSPEGRPVRLLDGSKDGRGPSALLSPRGLALSRSNLVYVTSKLTHELFVFSRDGALVHRYGQMGAGEGSFLFPSGLALDHSGRLFVVDTGNRRLAVLATAEKGVSPEMKVAQAGTGSRNPFLPPPRDAAIYQVAEEYVTALVAGEHETVYAMLTALHRQEWGQESFLLRPGAKELFPVIELADFRHTFVRYGLAQPGAVSEEAALLTVEYLVNFSNDREKMTVRIREKLVLRPEGEMWRIAASKRDILP